MLPEEDVQRIREWVDARNEGVPVEIRDKVRYELDVGHHDVTVFECRPPWKAEFGPEWTRMAVARLDFTTITNLWSLNWRDSDGVFHEYDTVNPTPDVGELLAEIDRDPTCIFWG